MKLFELTLISSSEGYQIEIWDSCKGEYLPTIKLGKLSKVKAHKSLFELEDKYNKVNSHD